MLVGLVLAPPRALVVTGVAGAGAAVRAAGDAGLAIRAWWRRDWGPVARAHFTAATLAAIALAWQLAHWSLLGLAASPR